MLRKLWRWSPKRKEIKKIQTCQICLIKVASEADHIVPVGRVPLGWEGWDSYLERLFDGDLQHICKDCHYEKTIKERRERNSG